jgi:hypothetical protein
MMPSRFTSALSQTIPRKLGAAPEQLAAIKFEVKLPS